MKKPLIALALAVALCGCAPRPFYKLEGARYDDPESFLAAQDALNERILASVTPLPKPVTKKKLVVMYPSAQAVGDENVRRFTNLNERSPAKWQEEQMRTMGKRAATDMRGLIDVIRKRGIYPEVDFRSSPSMVNSIEPGPEFDVLYYTEASQGTGQTFYASVKHGRQVFASDRTGTTPEAKAKAFIDAVQLMAIRE